MNNYWFLYNLIDESIYGAPYLGNASEWINIPKGCGVLGPFDEATASVAVKDAYIHPNYYLVQAGAIVAKPNILDLQLAEAKQAKIGQVNDAYAQAISTGFTSSASGSAMKYGYGDFEQKTFDDLSTMDLRGWVTYPFNVYAQDGTPVSITSKTQLDQLFKDIFSFKYPLKTKQHAYINQVNACATIDDVNKIIVTF